MTREGAINVSCAIDEESVMHGLWLMWMVVDDEEGSDEVRGKQRN